MVYIRTKKIKSDNYLYLVKSVWDSKRNTSKQEIVKYLGKASEVSKDDLPIDFRNDPKILSVLALHNPNDIVKKEESTKKSRQLLYKNLTHGDIHSSVKIYEDYITIFNPVDFFDKILRQVMYEIGEDWANNKINIATEHVASNVAQTLIRIIMDKVAKNANKKKILICVPVGEEHHLGCDVLETYLSIKGFRVYNMGTSVPTESLLSFIENNKPEIILISITLEDNISAGQRLVKKIKERYEIPILVGGFAIQSNKTHKFDATVIPDATLEEIPKFFRTA
jgi:methanogenic corrinoid protein MtbC1